MMKHLRQLAVLGIRAHRNPLLLIVFLAGASIGQGVCEASFIDANEISGSVRASRGSGNAILPGIQINLIEIGSGEKDDKLLASVISTRNGKFNFANIASGKYRIEATDPKDFFVRLSANIRLRSRRVVSSSDGVLSIEMGVSPLKPCGGGIVRPIKRARLFRT